jgi:hypothetical protein
MNTAIGIYPCTPFLEEFLAETYNAMDWSNFVHWHSMESLRTIVDDHENGRISDVAAINLLEKANEMKGTQYSFHDVMNLRPDFVFSPEGDSIIFYSGDSRDMFELFSCARFDEHPIDSLITGGRIINTIYVLTFDGFDGLLDVQEPSVIAMRSMWTRPRKSLGVIGGIYEVSDAMMPGDTETFTLPREACGIINCDLNQRRMRW